MYLADLLQDAERRLQRRVDDLTAEAAKQGEVKKAATGALKAVKAEVAECEETLGELATLRAIADEQKTAKVTAATPAALPAHEVPPRED